MYPQYVAARSSTDVRSDATLPQRGPKPMLSCLSKAFSTTLILGRTQAAYSNNRGRSAAEAAAATFGQEWSRKCQSQSAPLWRFMLCFLRPLAPPKSTKLSMSISRKSRLSRPLPANTSRLIKPKTDWRGRGFFPIGPAFSCADLTLGIAQRETVSC